MDKKVLLALERVVNQIGGGHTEDFYQDLALIKEWVIKKLEVEND